MIVAKCTDASALRILLSPPFSFNTNAAFHMEKTGNMNKKMREKLTHGNQPAAPKPRQRPHEHEREHAGREGAAQAPGHEDGGAGEEARPPAEGIGEAAVEGLEGGAGDEVGRRQPGGVVGGTELGRDERVRRRRDGAVEAREEDVGPERCAGAWPR